MGIVCFSRVFFVAPDLETAGLYLRRMVDGASAGAGFDHVLVLATLLGLGWNFVGHRVRDGYAGLSRACLGPARRASGSRRSSSSCSSAPAAEPQRVLRVLMDRTDWTPRALIGAALGLRHRRRAAIRGALDASARLANDDEVRPQALTGPLAALAGTAGWTGRSSDGLSRATAGTTATPGGASSPPPPPRPRRLARPAPPERARVRATRRHLRRAPGRLRASALRSLARLIVGASSIQFELGRALETQLEERDGLSVERWGRHSTGLSRADYFDWLEKGAELADAFAPDLVIAQVGGNDCQVITNVDGSEVARFGDGDAWDAAYAERVRAFVSVFTERGARVVVLGMPIMRSRSFRSKMSRLNAVAEGAVLDAHERFVSTWDWTADERGEYRGTAIIDGRERVTRADDGIHMTVHGAHDVAARILDELSRAIAFPEAPDPLALAIAALLSVSCGATRAPDANADAPEVAAAAVAPPRRAAAL